MKKGFKLALLVGFMILGFTGLAKAEIFIDFDNPDLFQIDEIYGYDWIYSTPYGDIGIYGDITNEIDGDTYLDNTAPDGSGNFLLGYGYDSAYLDFYNLEFEDGDGIGAFEFAWLAPQDNVWSGYYEDEFVGESEPDDYEDGNESPLWNGDGEWHFVSVEGRDGYLIRAIGFDGGMGEWEEYLDEQENPSYEFSWYDDGYAAADGIRLFTKADLTQNIASTETPEPASMALMGIGLLGLARRFRRKN